MSEHHPEIAKLVAQGKLPASVADKLSQLTPGTFVVSKSWGAGKIADWDLLGDKLVVDFEGKPGHALKLEFAAKSLDVLPEDHVLSRRFADRPGLQQMAEKQIPDFVKLVLKGAGGRISLDAFEDIVKGKIIPEGKFKSWWENAKKALRMRPEFVVPAKRTLPMELRDESISPADALLGDFTKARELKAKLKALENILKDVSIFSDSQRALEEVAGDAESSASQNIRLKPGDALELLLHRDDLVEKVQALKERVQYTLAQAVSQAADRIHEFLGAMNVGKQQRVLAALPQALGDDWADRALGFINRLSQRSLTELAKVFQKNSAEDRLVSHLRTNISQRNLSSEALAWVCWERSGLASSVFSADIASALLSAIERDHFDDDKKSNRVLDALMEDKELVADLISGADMTHINNFARQIMLSPAFEELSKRSLMARIIRVYPEVQELVEEHSGRKDDGHAEDLIVSWESLEAKKKAHQHLVQVEIPQNRKDIEIARSYGDLRENFEFKSAKEYQRVLMRRKMESERDLARARGTDFSDITSEKVGIGTIVTVRDKATGKEEEYTILGAWDGDPARHVISYLTATAKALANAVPGDSIELPTEDESIRHVEVLSIRKWFTGQPSAKHVEEDVPAPEAENEAEAASSAEAVAASSAEPTAADSPASDATPPAE